MNKKETIEQIQTNLSSIERKIYEFKSLLANNEDMLDDLKITLLGHLVCKIDDYNQENCNLITCGKNQITGDDGNKCSGNEED